MRVLVVGSNGLVNRHFVEIYKDFYDLTLIASKGNRHASIFSIEEFLKESSFKQVYYFDAMIIGVQTNSSHTINEFDLVKSLCEYISIFRPKLVIYFSTGGLYKFHDVCVTENSTLKDLDEMDEYFKTKFYSERTLASIVDHSKFVILRPFFIFGPGQKNHFLIPRLFGKLISNDNIKLDSRNGPLINPIYVHDVCLLLNKLISNSETLENKTTINVSGNELISLRDLISELEKIAGHSKSLIISENVQDTVIAASVNKVMKDPIFFKNSLRSSLQLTLVKQFMNPT